MTNPLSGQIYRISAPHFTAGIVVTRDGRIVASAPILAWARGKNFGFFKAYCVQKGWTLECLPQAETQGEGNDPSS